MAGSNRGNAHAGRESYKGKKKKVFRMDHISFWGKGEAQANVSSVDRRKGREVVGAMKMERCGSSTIPYSAVRCTPMGASSIPYC